MAPRIGTGLRRIARNIAAPLSKSSQLSKTDKTSNSGPSNGSKSESKVNDAPPKPAGIGATVQSSENGRAIAHNTPAVQQTIYDLHPSLDAPGPSNETGLAASGNPAAFDGTDSVRTQPPLRRGFIENLDGSTGPGGFEYEVSLSSGQTNEIDPEGNGTVDLTVSRTVVGEHAQDTDGVPTSSGSVPGSSTAAGANVFAGHDVTYTVTLPEDHYQQVLQGIAPLPDPGDLSTLPPGSSLMIEDSLIAGTESSATTQHVHGKNRATVGQGRAIGIEVTDDGDARVLAGPVEALTSEGFAGFGQRGIGFVGVTASTSAANYELDFLDLDPQTGGAAYADFLRTGEVPPASETGVQSSGTIRTGEIETSIGTGGELYIGPFELSGQFTENTIDRGSLTEIEYSDGRSETYGVVHGDSVSVFAQSSSDAGGRTVSEERGILLNDYSDGLNNVVADAFGTDTGGAENDARLVFTPDDYAALRERTIQSVVHGDEAHAEILSAGPDDQRLFDGNPYIGVDPLTTAIVNNPDLDSFLLDPDIRNQNSTGAMEALIRIQSSNEGQGPLDGNFTFF